MVLIWEVIKCKMMEKDSVGASLPPAVRAFFGASPHPALRAKVPDGWFIRVATGAFFYPDPEHAWDGSSLP